MTYLVGKETRNSPSSTEIVARYSQVEKHLGVIDRPVHRAKLEAQSEQRDVCSLPLRQKRVRKSRILAGAKTVTIHSRVSKLPGLTHVREYSGSDD